MILTLKEAAAFLKCNPEVLRQNLGKWGVPYMKLGSRYRFTENALLAYLNQRQAPKEEECPLEDPKVSTTLSVSREYDNLLAQRRMRMQKHLKTD